MDIFLRCGLHGDFRNSLSRHATMADTRSTIQFEGLTILHAIMSCRRRLTHPRRANFRHSGLSVSRLHIWAFRAWPRYLCGPNTLRHGIREIGGNPQTVVQKSCSGRSAARSKHPRCLQDNPRSLGSELPQRAQPIFHVKGLRDLTVPDGLDIDRHDPEVLAGVRHAEEFPRRRTGYLATHDHTVAGDEDVFNIFQAGNGVREKNWRPL
jgi:hypothetical protein